MRKLGLTKAATEKVETGCRIFHAETENVRYFVTLIDAEMKRYGRMKASIGKDP